MNPVLVFLRLGLAILLGKSQASAWGVPLTPAREASPEKALDPRLQAEGIDIPIRALWPKTPTQTYTPLTTHYAKVLGPYPRVVEWSCAEESSKTQVYCVSGDCRLETSGRHLWLGAPGTALLWVEGREPLVLIMDAEERRLGQSEPFVLEALHFGADPTGQRSSQAALQAAIDQAAKVPGGARVRVGAGLYLTGSLFMRNGVDLHLDWGATLKADPDDGTFPPEAYTRADGAHPATDPLCQRSLVWFLGVENASLTGSGTLDGDGHRRRLRGVGPERVRINQIRICDSRLVRVEGLTLVDAEFWSVHLLRSEQITLRRLSILNERVLLGWNPLRPESHWNNTDGINPDSCRNILVEDVYVEGGDDCLVVKATSSGPGQPPNTENLLFRRALLASTTTAVKFGTESLARRLGNVVFEDVLVGPHNRGRCLALAPRDTALLGPVVFSNIDLSATSEDWLNFEVWKREATQTATAVLEGLVFENVKLHARSRARLDLHGSSSDLRSIVFRSLTRQGRVLTELGDLGFGAPALPAGFRLEP